MPARVSSSDENPRDVSIHDFVFVLGELAFKN